MLAPVVMRELAEVVVADASLEHRETDAQHAHELRRAVVPVHIEIRRRAHGARRRGIAQRGCK
jgi:hypothetical protein